ncbi:MAG: IclR family transcriptional regulator [Bacteroidetes bacterium MedPE-SWsnd-G2]|nr:MAG: IclR family transcriptional regulator [Bacteroidetes bacterium MedPE-SWsnd-G2]
MDNLIHDIKKCSICVPHLQLGPRPVIAVSKNSKIIIIGQAPGVIVHNSGVPWDDLSGENLRSWMGIDKSTFYNIDNIALIPMGFCYPGKGPTGDLPPRKECAPLWHDQLLSRMSNVKLILLVGAYAQNYYLKSFPKLNLTQRVQNFETYLPHYFVLPHPSPRNNIWQTKNSWFKSEVMPQLKLKIQDILL